VINEIKAIIPESYKKKTLKILFFLLLSMVLESLGLGLLLPVVNLILDPGIVDNYKILVDFLYKHGINSHHQLIMLVMTIFGCLYLVKSLLLIYVSNILADFSYGISNEISAKLFASYIRQPYLQSINTNSANLQRNITSEVLQFTALISNVLFLISEIAIALSILATLLYINLFGAITIMGFLIFLAIIYYRVTKNVIYKLGNDRLCFDQKRTFTLIQSLGSFKEVKLLNKESFFIEKFEKLNTLYFNVLKRNQIFNQLPRNYFEFSAVLGLVFFVILSVNGGEKLTNLVSVLSVFLLAAFRLLPSSNRIFSNIQAIRYSYVSISFLSKEFDKIKDEIEQIKDFEFDFKAPIIIDNVSFSYSNNQKKAIDQVNLEIPASAFVGIIGESGSGKSTFVDNLIGLLKPNSGEITIGGVNIHEFSSAWMSNIGYVPQNIFMSDSSIRENIAFGVDEIDIDDKKIYEVLQYVEMLDFVKSLEMGIFTNIGENGSKLSGGQRQRLGIARAFYNNPKLLILDEATSALDSETEKQIIESILKIRDNRTILMISHRLSTLSKCQMVIKFDNSKMSII
jgi:ABC-type multidrug transport system fused ATPase/permease subunit